MNNSPHWSWWWTCLKKNKEHASSLLWRGCWNPLDLSLFSARCNSFRPLSDDQGNQGPQGPGFTWRSWRVGHVQRPKSVKIRILQELWSNFEIHPLCRLWAVLWSPFNRHPFGASWSFFTPLRHWELRRRAGGQVAKNMHQQRRTRKPLVVRKNQVSPKSLVNKGLVTPCCRKMLLWKTKVANYIYREREYRV